MFLPTFEALASKHSTLRLIFEGMDSEVTDSAKALLDPEFFASQLGCQIGDVQAAAVAAQKAGVLEAVDGFLCVGEHCLTWQPTSSAVCDECNSPMNGKLTSRRYRLSAAGIAERLRATGGLGTPARWSTSASDHRGKIRAAIVTIKQEEEAAVLKRFPSEAHVRGIRDYHLGRVTHVDGRTIFVATVRLPGQGNLEATTVVGQVMDDLAPDCVFLVGIAGASPWADAVIGDVVLGTHVHDLTLALDDVGGEREWNGEGGGMSDVIVSAATYLRPALEQLPSIVGAPTIDANTLSLTTDDDDLNARIRAKLLERFGCDSNGAPKAKTTVFTGAIMSSDNLVKNPQTARKWTKTRRAALAIDMEFAGAYRAARVPGRTSHLLAIRAISDIVGMKKVESAVRYACEVAAEHALAFVTRWTP